MLPEALAPANTFTGPFGCSGAAGLELAAPDASRFAADAGVERPPSLLGRREPGATNSPILVTTGWTSCVNVSTGCVLACGSDGR